MGDPLSAADFKSSMDKILVEIISVRDELTTLKGDQSRLTVAVNRLQSDKHESGPSGENDDDKDADTQKPPPLPPPPPPTHKLRFPKYDGAEDPIGWLHKCEQFLWAHCTTEDEKVLTASYYMEGTAQQWYYRLERNRGVPTWP